MKRPNIGMWSDKFLAAVVKNVPGIELDPTSDQLCALAVSVLKEHIEKKYGHVVPLAALKGKPQSGK